MRAANARHRCKLEGRDSRGPAACPLLDRRPRRRGITLQGRAQASQAVAIQRRVLVEEDLLLTRLPLVAPLEETLDVSLVASLAIFPVNALTTPMLLCAPMRQSPILDVQSPQLEGNQLPLEPMLV